MSADSPGQEGLDLIPEEPKEIPGTTLAYIAGLFDGEGNVTVVRQITKGKVIGFGLTTHINMTDTSGISVCREVFGGRFYSYSASKIAKGHKIQHDWVLGGKAAATFLNVIRPYCKVKAKEIDIALRFAKYYRPRAGKGEKGAPKERSIQEFKRAEEFRQELLAARIGRPTLRRMEYVPPKERQRRGRPRGFSVPYPIPPEQGPLF